MSNFELNFNQSDYNIITEVDSNGNAITSPDELFGSTITDYLRLTVLDTGNNLVIDGEGNQAIYYSSPNSQTFTVQVPGNVDNPNVQLGSDEDNDLF